MTSLAPVLPLRERVRRRVEAPSVQRLIIALIALNAVTLGLETWPAAMAAAGALILATDRILLAVFTLEIALRLYAHRLRFFRDPWSVFDFTVIGIALIPAAEGASVLRALRVLRILRLISAIPRMRMVVEALLSALPGIGSIAALLALIFYVAAVMATKLFGAAFPEWFGSVGNSLFTLFQIMTLESWSMGIVRPVMAEFPYAWAFFVPFILIATFTVLNLFIAVVVGAMQSENERAENERAAGAAGAAVLLAEIRALRQQIEDLRQHVTTLPIALPGLPEGAGRQRRTEGMRRGQTAGDLLATEMRARPGQGLSRRQTGEDATIQEYPGHSSDPVRR